MKIQHFILKHGYLIAILILAVIVRFWRIHDLTTFSGDQGVDFLIVKKMLIDGEITLLGPKLGHFSDIANIYLGPAYYYIISLPLYLSGFDPIGPILFVTVLSVITIILVYLFVKQYFSSSIALITSLLFAFSAPVIEQSRVPLNPNLIPFFTILLLFSLYKIVFDKKNVILWPFVLGFSSGILFQLHYLTITIILISHIAVILNKNIRIIVTSLAAFILAISPQILFELRHDYFITNQIILRMKSVDEILSSSNFIVNTSISISILLTSIFTSKYIFIGLLLLVMSLVTTYKIPLIYKQKYFLLMTMLFFSILVSSSTSFNPQFHYLSHTFVPFIIIFSMAAHMGLNAKIPPIFKLSIIIVLISVIALNLSVLNLDRTEGYTMAKGWNLTGIKKSSRIISDDVSSNKFNIVATLDGDTRARPYRFLVETYGKIPLGVENYPESEILYLVSRESEQEILNYSVWEVSSFKPFKFEREWPIQNGIKLYKLSKESP